jgi:hypothetical protein
MATPAASPALTTQAEQAKPSFTDPLGCDTAIAKADWEKI